MSMDDFSGIKQPELFKLYFEYMHKKEPPRIYNRWSMLTCLAALLGRQYWFPWGESAIFPNIYTILIGEAGARKSSAIKHAIQLLEMTGYTDISASKTSREKFFMDLAKMDDDPSINGKLAHKSAENMLMSNLFGGSDNVDKTPMEVLIDAGELGSFFGRSASDFMIDLGDIWDWHNVNRPWEFKFKNSRSISIWQPTISILAGTNYAGFKLAIPVDMLEQGFLSRSILVFSEPSGRKETIPSKAPDSLRTSIVEILLSIKETVRGPAEFTKEAHGALDRIYKSDRQPVGDIRFKAYCHRRHTQLIKMCLLVSASYGRTVIDLESVILANTILAYAESFMSRALGQFGASKTSDAANTIIEILTNAKGVIGHNELWAQMNKTLSDINDMARILHSLMQADQIQCVEKPKMGYLIKRSRIQGTLPFVDFNILTERES